MGVPPFDFGKPVWLHLGILIWPNDWVAVGWRHSDLTQFSDHVRPSRARRYSIDEMVSVSPADGLPGAATHTGGQDLLTNSFERTAGRLRTRRA
jgi:hypothetical protein